MFGFAGVAVGEAEGDTALGPAIPLPPHPAPSTATPSTTNQPFEKLTARILAAASEPSPQAESGGLQAESGPRRNESGTPQGRCEGARVKRMIERLMADDS